MLENLDSVGDDHALVWACKLMTMQSMANNVKIFLFILSRFK